MPPGPQAANVRLVLDPGHGGNEPAGRSTPIGAVGPTLLREKDVTLALAQSVAQRFGNGAVLTRSDDVNVSLGSRAAMATRSGADVFVSIHANSGAPGRNGTEIYVHPRAGTASHALAASLAHALTTTTATPPVYTGELAVLSPEHVGAATAACLVEVDYLSSSACEMRLSDPGIPNRLAGAIAEGIRRYGERTDVSTAQQVETVAIIGLGLSAFSLVNALYTRVAGSLTYTRNITRAIHTYPPGTTPNPWQDARFQVFCADATRFVVSSAWAMFDVHFRYNGNDIDQCHVELSGSDTWSLSSLNVTFEGSEASSYETDSVACIRLYISGRFDPAGGGDADFEGSLLIKADGTIQRLGMRTPRGGDGVVVWDGPAAWITRHIEFTGQDIAELSSAHGSGGYWLKKRG